MKITRDFICATVTKKAEDQLKNGHPWVYADEITKIDAEPENGSLVDVLSEKGSYLGTGFYSKESKIRIRVISKNANDKFDEAFYKRRLTHAWEYRKTVMGSDISASRIIFGEADFFPGLTVDLFSDVLVAQTLSIGTEKIKDILFPALFDLLKKDGVPLRGIYERNDVKLRELEGIPQYTGWYDIGEKGPTETKICENGIYYHVDFENGQKTGFFLDQKYNRRAVSALTKGRRVLDCFTHTGSFALNAKKGGAEHVTAVDISSTATDMAKRNAELNGLEMEYITANVFDLLPELIASHAKYDFIILDPPAFTKSRKTMLNAMGGYREINQKAMRLLPRGGYLATASCSHFASFDVFKKMLLHAAGDAGVSLRLVEVRGQAPDHPVLMGVPETEYLKFFIFQVV
ncbi:MAG: class I SAM-dependent rRNA methyltransferase [Clostridiales bacterium]|nr:class I SAM-dependent rRNA methyltransferase [Clostridiales bacterium]